MNSPAGSSKSPSAKVSGKSPESVKKDRLAAALKENLKRRKAAASKKP